MSVRFADVMPVLLVAVVLFAALGCSEAADAPELSVEPAVSPELVETVTVPPAPSEIAVFEEEAFVPETQTSIPEVEAPVPETKAVWRKPIVIAQATKPRDGGSITFKKESTVPEEDREKFDSGFQWGESEKMKAAEAAQAEEEKSKLEAELKQARLEAEQAKAEAAALKKEMAEREAAAKHREEESRVAAAAEQKRLVEATKRLEAERARLEEEDRKRAEAAAALKKAEEETAKKAAAEAVARKSAEEEAARKHAEAEAEAAKKAEALAKKSAGEETSRKRAEAEAAKKAEALAKKSAGEEAARKRAEAEVAERKRAEEDAARKKAEAESAQKKALAERERAKQKAAQKTAAAEKEAETRPPVAAGEPSGVILGIDLDEKATRGGEAGISITVSVEAANLDGAQVETAVYFFGEKGDKLKDRDSAFRSSIGQVYVGQYRQAKGNPFGWREELFIPNSQMDIPSGGDYALKAQVVIWEYSKRRGQAIARSDFVSFTFSQGSTEHDRRQDIVGAWSDGVTITREGGAYAVQGLELPGTIQEQRWGYSDGVLTGVVTVRRRLGIIRLANFELQISKDGGTLSGTYRLTDRKGEPTKDSQTVTLTR